MKSGDVANVVLLILTDEQLRILNETNMGYYAGRIYFSGKIDRLVDVNVCRNYLNHIPYVVNSFSRNICGDLKDEE